MTRQPNQLVPDLKRKVEIRCAVLGIKPAECARLAGMAPTALWTALKRAEEGSSPKVSTLRRLADVLRLRVEVLVGDSPPLPVELLEEPDDK